MINVSLSLTNFRNHKNTNVTWGEHVNIITGPNGAGKTNLLDALHYLCMGRSFTGSPDQYVLRQGQPSFLVKGTFKGNIRSTFEVACSYGRGEGKKLKVNESPLERYADLIGRVPVVIVSPDDIALTGEGPSQRRSFIDALISQTSATYLDDLMRYRKTVRQRNRLLTDLMDKPEPSGVMLEPWNRQLTETGARIVLKRKEMIRQFKTCLERAHEQIAGSGLIPSVVYKTICETDCEEDVTEQQIRDTYTKDLEKVYEKERERRQTIIGPHRDDLIFFLNDMELRKFGSRGQHRIFALALKMAQLYFYTRILEDLPIFLLDDVFGDLDREKTDIVMNMLLQHSGQSFVTAAHPDKISGFHAAGKRRISEYQIQNGRLEKKT